MKVRWIEASAGCGKTTYLLNSCDNVFAKSLFITFSKAAAEELRLRLQDANSYSEVTTLHSLAYKIIKLYFPNKEICEKKLDKQALSFLLSDTNFFKIFNWLRKNNKLYNIDQKIIIEDFQIPKPIFYVETLNFLYRKDLIEQIQIDQVAKYFDKNNKIKKKILNEFCVPQSLERKFSDEIFLLFTFHKNLFNDYFNKIKSKITNLIHYQELKMKDSLNVLYYEDLIVEAKNLISLNEEIIFQIFGNIKRIYIDEAQDLSKEQWELIYIILSYWKDFNGELIVAGDSKQIIYDFQGADIKHFKNFKKKIQNLAITFEEVELNNTYRIAQKLCSYLNQIFSSLGIDYTSHNSNNNFEGSLEILKINSFQDLLPLINSETMILFRQKNEKIKNFAQQLIQKGFLLNSPYIMQHPIIKDFQYLLKWLVYKDKFALGVVFNAFGKQDLSFKELTLQEEFKTISSFNYENLEELFFQWIAIPSLQNFLRFKLANSYDFFLEFIRKYASFYRYEVFYAIHDSQNFYSNHSIFFEQGIFFNTIHASKGKEADSVMLLEFDTNTRFNNENYRLLYVALTRMRKKLILPIQRNDLKNTWAEKLTNIIF